MIVDPRRLAVALAGLCAFLNLYATQSLLPLFAHEFHATPAEVSLTVSAPTFAIAIVAPFVGILADLLGRKRIIVGAMFLMAIPTALIAMSGDLHQLIIGRFVQGVLLPPIFTVTVAYIGDEWAADEVPAVAGIYISGSALGGFLGRFVSGIVSEAWGWRSAFLALAAITIVCAAVVAIYLPREKKFVRSTGLAGSFRAMADHLKNPRLLATYTVGFTTLFAFLSSFTYINFYLAAPPFHLSSAGLGSIFVVYLLGVVSTPMAAGAVTRFGRRAVAIGAVGLWSLSLILTMIPSLAVIIGALALAAASGFVFQTCATSFLTSAASHARSSAVGLYATCYYVGGSVGAVAPAPFWHLFGWPGCVGLTVSVLVAGAVVVHFFWRDPGPTKAA